MIIIKDKMIMDDGTIVAIPKKVEPIIEEPIEEDGEVDESNIVEETEATTKPNNKPKHK